MGQLPDSSERGAGRHVGGYATYASHIQGQDMSGNKGDKMSIYHVKGNDQRWRATISTVMLQEQLPINVPQASCKWLCFQ